MKKTHIEKLEDLNNSELFEILSRISQELDEPQSIQIPKELDEIDEVIKHQLQNEIMYVTELLYSNYGFILVETSTNKTVCLSKILEENYL